MNGPYNETFADGAVNTGIAASASETLASTAALRREYGPFNFLEVINRGPVDVEVRLDGINNGRHVIVCPANVITTRGPEADPIPSFNFILQVNLSAAVAETAGNIRFRWGNREAV